MTDFAVRLFYSYCHKDASYRESMERFLAHLRRQGYLREWHDAEILPGRNIRPEIREKMDQADIIVFLFSPDFINSEECMKEWRYAKQLADSGRHVFRIPIILRICSWLDVLGNDDVRALPNDGNSISSYGDQDEAWHQVYEGIKKVVEALKTSFTPKIEFLEEINKTEFLSQEHLKLEDLFIFPRLAHSGLLSNGELTKEGFGGRPIIHTLKQLLDNKYVLIYGPEKSGKTALARYIYLSLVEESRPVLFLDSNRGHGGVTDAALRRAYAEQFNGDYSVWVKETGKTLIVDDLGDRSHLPSSLDSAKEIFDTIIAFSSSSVYVAYYFDDHRFAEFVPMEILPLTSFQQEGLIRTRLALRSTDTQVTDGFVDRVEDRVNSIIVSQRLLPRFPFYVLSILQTYEAYMPTGFSITSYGHCYQSLIYSHLVLSGIPGADTDINVCYNFLERLAHVIYQCQADGGDGDFDFEGFVSEYKNNFNIRDSIINRLKTEPYNLIDNVGNFRTRFMYYYFLGKFLATEGGKLSALIIEDMCINTHREGNYLTLLFVIHHTSDDSVIYNLLYKTMDILKSISPATLAPDETQRFAEVLAKLPEHILSSQTVNESRKDERQHRDAFEAKQAEIEETSEAEIDEPPNEFAEPINDLYKVLRNSQIIGQILRNRYGNLDRQTIEDIIQTIADGGLQLVNVMLESQDHIEDWAIYISQKWGDWSIEELKEALRIVSFQWTMLNIEIVVGVFNVPEIREDIESVVKKNSTPAFDLIKYFCLLDGATELTERERNGLRSLLREHDDLFIRRVLSLRTQRYMNTHRSKEPIERSICSVLGIGYRPRLSTHSET